ncbi:outer membrane protein assembly factor [Dysgonomonas sp. 25]|uniref:BamA/OMP85 family outer membrane protein n=1 Tax=Dysgonomonas sp. 25 TaxID=2302933 RepID=UPI00351B9380
MSLVAQVTENTTAPEVVATSIAINTDTVPYEVPTVSYNYPKKYTIEDIKVSGVKNPMYEDYVLIGVSELSVGDVIEIPGNEITNAVKKYWKIGLFSDVSIEIAREDGNKAWLEIKLKERPRISDIQITGVKKSERQDIEMQNSLVKNLQITPSQIDKTRNRIKKYFNEKGFNNAEVKVVTEDDLSKENYVILKIDVIKKNRTHVNNITIVGNEEVKASTLEKAMKKTRHKHNLGAKIRNFLRSTKYTPEGYEEDKMNLIEKYNELGYRDAMILADTVFSAATEGKPDKVNVELRVEEGPKYYIRDIKWVGNTKYNTAQLQQVLMMKPGDIYNQKKLMERLVVDDDAVSSYFYQNNGYLFAKIDPIEANIVNDSIDLEMRVSEGPQATIRKVSISGNDRLYEDVIRRELRIRPGALYSKENIVRSLREIAQMGHFDPEQLSNPQINPDIESGTVDIGLPLVSKANDQIEFSAGWGNTGLIGKLSLKFSNFSIKNLLYPSTYKGIIPQGDGQTLTLSAQTNARYYQSYSISFFDPWFGGKRPNSLSVGLYYSKQTDINSNYLSNAYGGYGYNYGYNYGYGSNYGDYSIALDPNKSIQMFGASIGYGKRLTWPDDYFTFQAELSYQMYKMRDWAYFVVRNGTSSDLSMNLTLRRSSIDNPMFTRRGSDFSLSLQFTPPFSAWDGKDYKSMQRDKQGYESGKKYRWVEYHKWKFKARTFTPLLQITKTPVLMTRVEYGILGYYNKHKRSPFGTFYVGGDGMSGYSSTYATETIGLRGYENGSLASEASAYTRLSMELRYPIILEPSSTIYALGFVEAGNAWSDLGDINPFELKRSAGVGVRIILPMIGLMGIDWAYGFDKVNGSRSDSGSQIHFILGQEF